MTAASAHVELQARSAQLSPTQIPHTRKLWDDTSHCHCKPSFGMIYHTAKDSTVFHFMTSFKPASLQASHSHSPHWASLEISSLGIFLCTHFPLPGFFLSHMSPEPVPSFPPGLCLNDPLCCVFSSPFCFTSFLPQCHLTCYIFTCLFVYYLSFRGLPWWLSW